MSGWHAVTLATTSPPRRVTPLGHLHLWRRRVLGLPHPALAVQE